jgi:hypothetical protein
MLRALIVALLLLNLAFFAWTRGWLDAVVGLRSTGDREPERMLRQVRPELIRILPASAAIEAAPVVLACFETGPFTDAEIGAAEARAQAQLPAGSWVSVKTEQPGTWLVYMGRYASRDALTRKEEELKRRKAPYEEIGVPPALAPGLSLGRFEQRAAAVTALEQFTQQGIRTARVVELVPASNRHMLRVEKADPALSAQLVALPAETFGKAFAGCAKPGGS